MVMPGAWEDLTVWGWAKRNFVTNAHPLRVPRTSGGRAGQAGLAGHGLGVSLWVRVLG